MAFYTFLSIWGVITLWVLITEVWSSVGCIIHLSITFRRDVNLMLQNVKQPLVTQSGRNLFSEAHPP